MFFFFVSFYRMYANTRIGRHQGQHRCRCLVKCQISLAFDILRAVWTDGCDAKQNPFFFPPFTRPSLLTWRCETWFSFCSIRHAGCTINFLTVTVVRSCYPLLCGYDFGPSEHDWHFPAEPLQALNLSPLIKACSFQAGGNGIRVSYLCACWHIMGHLFFSVSE